MIGLVYRDAHHRAVITVIDAGSGDVKSLASRFGVDVSNGWRRIALDLIPEADVSLWGDVYIDTGEIAISAKPPTITDVRLEAQRRMMALLGARDPAHLDILISNGSREAIRLMRKGAESWSAEEAQRAAMLEQIDAAIEAIRAASNALEAMEPIPADFTDDTHWP